jgi:hypothetical protein
MVPAAAIAGFERTWNYDASYLHLIDTDPQAMLAFGKLQAIGHYRKDVPPCGRSRHHRSDVRGLRPCTQLGIDMAEHGGVDQRCACHRRARLRRHAMRWRWWCALPRQHCATCRNDELRERWCAG